VRSYFCKSGKPFVKVQEAQGIFKKVQEFLIKRKNLLESTGSAEGFQESVNFLRKALEARGFLRKSRRRKDSYKVQYFFLVRRHFLCFATC
jgi:hypothetical protein